MSEPNNDRPPRGNKPNRPQQPNQPTPPNGMKVGRGMLGWILFAGLAIMLYMLVTSKGTRINEIPLSTFWSSLGRDEIQLLTIEGDEVRGKFYKPQTYGKHNASIQEFRVAVPTGTSTDWRFTAEILERKGQTEVRVENNANLVMNLLLPLIPWILIILFLYFFVFRALRSSAGAGGMLGSFGRSRHKVTHKELTNITFDDVAGVEEAKDEVREIVEFLRNPKKFQRLGGRIPRGVLLVGEPGTGKTLLAKAIAGEADAPFFSISGSDFVEMFVGVGASRVRDLFKQAKENAPCIIFLDEIDAVGRRRGSGFSSGGHDEREQTLNAILVEMDGFETNDQIIVVASTNRVDVLDPALTRPGRFDRQVYVPLPDVKGRFEILKVHARKVKLGPAADLLRLARATPGFSGADLAAIINEAALMATLANKDFIEQDDLEESRDKVRWGRAKKSRVIDEKDRLATAYHEAGHAVVQWLERETADPIHKVTVIPRGRALGATMTLPEKDRTNYSRKWSMSNIRMGLAGRIAEAMFTGDINTGAGGDIRMVTNLARAMVRDWGMNDRVGFVYYGEDENRQNPFGMGSREYSEETARIIDEEVKKLIDTLESETRALLDTHRDRVEALAKALVKYETLDGTDVDRVMRGENLTKPTVSDLLERESKRPTPPAPTPPPETGLGPVGPVPSPA
jgi:cell division protease FtsH